MVWIDRLREEGFVITHDWTVDDVACTPLTDADLPPGEREKRATDDLNGVAAADVFWLLAPIEASGAWTEFGYALAYRRWLKPCLAKHLLVLVSGPTYQRTIFTSQADVGFASDQQMFEHLVSLKAAPRR